MSAPAAPPLFDPGGLRLDACRAARYRFDLEAVDPLHLPPYQASTFRGGFGHAFKKMVCQQADWLACTPCQRGNACPYGYIFETTVPEGSRVLRNLQEVPNPFIIEAPTGARRDYRPGDRPGFDLLLVGRAGDYLPYFLLAFQELGRMGIGHPRGRYVLQRISAVHPWSGAQELRFDGVDVHVGGRDLGVSFAEVAERAAGLPTRRLTLRFLTPTRIKHQDRFVARPDFHVLVRSLLRRLSSLAYFHCGQLWEADFRAIIAAAEAIETERRDVEWVDWERYSTRQQQRMNLGGFVGEATYRGELAPFRALLALGELLHVGKATVFGNGKYVIDG